MATTGNTQGLTNPVQSFVSAHANGVYFQPQGGNLTLLAITGTSWDEEIARLAVTHSLSGGVVWRIANTLDGRGTVNADFDLNNPPYLSPPQLFAGQRGLILKYVSPSRFFQIPCIIAKLHFEGVVQGGQEKYSFDVEMDGGSGLYVRPAGPGA